METQHFCIAVCSCMYHKFFPQSVGKADRQNKLIHHNPLFNVSGRVWKRTLEIIVNFVPDPENGLNNAMFYRNNLK